MMTRPRIMVIEGGIGIERTDTRKATIERGMIIITIIAKRSEIGILTMRETRGNIVNMIVDMIGMRMAEIRIDITTTVMTARRTKREADILIKQRMIKDLRMTKMITRVMIEETVTRRRGVRNIVIEARKTEETKNGIGTTTIVAMVSGVGNIISIDGIDHLLLTIIIIKVERDLKMIVHVNINIIGRKKNEAGRKNRMVLKSPPSRRIPWWWINPN